MKKLLIIIALGIVLVPACTFAGNGHCNGNHYGDDGVPEPETAGLILVGGATLWITRRLWR